MFEYEKSPRRAIDRERNLEVSDYFGYPDFPLPQFLFANAGGPQFRFYAKVVNENREIAGVDGNTLVAPISTGAIITFKAVLVFNPVNKKWLQPTFFSLNDSDQREALRDGLFCLLTRGGELLRYAPEFSVRFDSEVGTFAME